MEHDDYVERREALRAIAFGNDPKVRPSDRVSALAALHELERQWDPPLPTSEELTEAAAQELADDEERLAKVIELFMESGLLEGAIQERASEIGAEAARQRFRAVDEPPEAVEAAVGAPEHVEEPTEAEDAAEDPPEAVEPPGAVEAAPSVHWLHERAARMAALDDGE